MLRGGGQAPQEAPGPLETLSGAGSSRERRRPAPGRKRAQKSHSLPDAQAPGPELAPGLCPSHMRSWDNHCKSNTAKRGSDSNSAVRRKLGTDPPESQQVPCPQAGTHSAPAFGELLTCPAAENRLRKGRKRGKRGNEPHSTPSCEPTKVPGPRRPQDGRGGGPGRQGPPSVRRPADHRAQRPHTRHRGLQASAWHLL